MSLYNYNCEYFYLEFFVKTEGSVKCLLMRGICYLVQVQNVVVVIPNSSSGYEKLNNSEHLKLEMKCIFL
jgi:hypothetical protein